MDPFLSDLTEDNNLLRFRLTNIDVSLANAIRRIILSEIPTVVFRAFPYDKNNIDIELNTSRLNNEIIKQRMSCIPIHITDIDFAIKEHIVEIQQENSSDVIRYVTTEDIRILNTVNNKYLSTEETRRIFPPDSITKYYIDITRLRPRLSESMPGEQIKMKCKLSVGTAKENSSFNVASTCSYGAVVDPVKVNSVWTEKAKQLKKDGKSAEDIDYAHKDWLLLGAKRLTLPNAFQFTVGSVGVFSNMSIMEKAIQIMLNKLRKFNEDMESKEEMIVASESTIPNCYDARLEGEDYTLGKVIEYILYAKHYDKQSKTSDKTLTYCGFNKPHPQIDISIIRIGFKNPIEKDIVVTYLAHATNDAIKIYEKLQADFGQ